MSPKSAWLSCQQVAAFLPQKPSFFSTLSQVLMPAHNGDFHVGPFGKYFFYNDVHRERDFSAKGEWEEGDSLGRVKALLL